MEVFESGGRTYAMVAAWKDGGVQIMDITDPARPIPVSAVFDGLRVIDTMDGAYEVEVFDSGGRTYAMVAAVYDHGIQIMDITDPARPTPTSAVFDGSEGFTALDRAVDVEVFESGGRTYAMVAAVYDNGAVQIMDITDPARPTPNIGGL